MKHYHPEKVFCIVFDFRYLGRKANKSPISISYRNTRNAWTENKPDFIIRDKYLYVDRQRRFPDRLPMRLEQNSSAGVDFNDACNL